MKNTLRSIYKLNYDTLNSNSGLPKWYNMLIDKPLDKITIYDVSKMIRQNIQLDFAVDKSIEFLVNDPFAGEMLDGDLLSTLASVISKADLKRNNNYNSLASVIHTAKESIDCFEWGDEKSKLDFIRTLSKVNSLL